MHPIICKIGPVTIYSFGLMLAAAVLVCSYLLGKEAALKGIAKDLIHDFVFLIVFSGLVGARIFYILLNLDFFKQNPKEIMMIQNGGLAWQGGLLAAALTGIVFIRRKGLPILKFADLAAPYIALGQAIGRVGCFLNGCCYGKPVWWGVYFPVYGERLHPTQLYDSFGLLIIFLILRKIERSIHVPGKVFSFYLMLASFQRFIIEFWRADHQFSFFGLSEFQVGSIVIFSIGMILFSRLSLIK